MQIGNLGRVITGAAASMASAGAAAAQDLPIIGIPWDAGVDFQIPATSLARDLQWVDTFLLWIIAGITLFVMALLLIVVLRFGHKTNPTPARFTHHSLIEVLWTVIPIIILVVLAVPSLQLLDEQMELPEDGLVIKAIGNQWYWSYEYPDEEIAFDSIMVAGGFATWEDVLNDESAREEVEEYGVTRETWRLATDTAMVIPTNTDIILQVTGADVIHAWTIPAFGVKIDAMPGRLNEIWFNVDRPGVYFGQCSELCGKDHAYMPITVIAVDDAEYLDWLEEARDLYATGPRQVEVAAAAE